MFDTTTHEKTWNESVSVPALHIANALKYNENNKNDQISNDRLNAAKEVFGNPTVSKKDPTLKWKKIYCDVCQIELDGQHEYEVHLKSKKHRNLKHVLKKKRRKIERPQGEKTQS